MTKADTMAARPLIQALLDQGASCGYELIEINVLQGADTFIDLSGEEIARRLYMVENDGGRRLALRPDFTIPVALAFLEKGGKGEARLAYSGSIFRRPAETQQVGFECLGASEGAAVETEILTLALDGIAASGIQKPTLAMGDLGLLEAMLDAVPLVNDRRAQLKHAVGNPVKFSRLLAHYRNPGARYEGDPDRAAFLDRFSGVSEERAILLVEDRFAESGLVDPVGRGVSEIAGRLIALAADRDAAPMDKAHADALTSYLALKGQASGICDMVAGFASAHDFSIDPALERLAIRHDALEKQGLDLADILFDASFGRSLEYYTGFVFEVWSGPTPEAGVLAGGGRYDALLSALGAKHPITAVGCGLRIADILQAGGRA